MATQQVVLQLSAQPQGNLGAPMQQIGRAAQQAAQQVKQLQQQQRAAAGQFGLGALSLNSMGMATGTAGMAFGMGPAAGMAASYAAITIGADKSAKALEILQNSTLNAGQKADKLAEQFIPGARAFIALRQAINGVNEALRKMERQFQFSAIQIRGQREVQRGELDRLAKMRNPAFLSQELGQYARRLSNSPPAGAFGPRGTLAQEIAFQNAQRLLPGRYALGRAQAEASAASRDYAAQGSTVEALKKEQRALLARRDAQMAGLDRSVRNARGDVYNTDENRIDINQRAVAARRTILEIDQQRETLEKELNRHEQLGLTLAEKKSAVRKAQIGIDQAELANLQAKEQRSAGLAFKIGSMTPGEKMMTLQALRSAQRVGLSKLAPSQRRRVESFLPEYAQKEYEKTVPLDALYREAAKLGGKDFIEEKGDFAGLRRVIQEKAAKIQVDIILDAEQTAQKIAKALGPVLRDLVNQIKVKNENAVEELRRGQQQRNVNQ